MQHGPELSKDEHTHQGHHFDVVIDQHHLKANRRDPNGTELLALVDKRPCAYELIQLGHKDETNVVSPDERVDLHTHKRYLTAHKELVEFSIAGELPGDQGKVVLTGQRGPYSVAQILGFVGLTTDTHMLMQEIDGQPPVLVPSNQTVDIQGCEIFYVQLQSGASS